MVSSNKTTSVVVCLLVLVSGCSGFSIGTDSNQTTVDNDATAVSTLPTATPSPTIEHTRTETSTSTPTHTPTPDPQRQALDAVLADMPDEEAAAVREQALVDDAVDDEDLAVARLLANSSGGYRSAVLRDVPYDDGWRADNSTVLRGEARHLYETGADDIPAELDRVRRALASDRALEANDVAYMQRLFNGQYNRSQPYSVVEQARRAGLLNASIADTEITDTELAALERTDGDVLIDGLEKELGTDPADPDTDGDGLQDGWEVYLTELYPDADPQNRDMYIEVDRMDGAERLPDTALEDVRRQFSRINGENPGLQVHFGRDDTVPERRSIEFDSSGGSEDYYLQNHFDHNGEGYFYVVVSTKDPVVDGESYTGVADVRQNWLFVNGNRDQKLVRGTLLHESGHAAGLSSDLYRGIDSRAVEFQDYPSIMNYNWYELYLDDSENPPIKFSDGENSRHDFDDLRHLDKNFSQPDTSDVEIDGKN